MNILVTGGAGFIGSHFVRYLIHRHPDCQVVNLDKLTYAGNRENVQDLDGHPRHRFVQGDICDENLIESLMKECEVVLNFAAWSHVDRSILEAGPFLKTNVQGVAVLLEAARRHRITRFLQISTDEVYGAVPVGKSSEDSPLAPSNPYAASKAAADLLALSYWKTHRLPALITRSSNNFGPYQYPEKFIALAITNALENRPIPLYGDGQQVRPWIYVEDHCEAVALVLEQGEIGGIYNIGSEDEWTNLEVAQQICRLCGRSEELIRSVKDRPGHDRRYALDTTRIRQLGWQPRSQFLDKLKTTVEWFREHRSWWLRIKQADPEFQAYYAQQYGQK